MTAPAEIYTPERRDTGRRLSAEHQFGIGGVSLQLTTEIRASDAAVARAVWLAGVLVVLAVGVAAAVWL